MYELSDRDLLAAIEHTRSIDNDTADALLHKFQIEQAALAETIFTVFPSLIEQQNQEMAELFLGLCFDIIFVYQYAFGEAPIENEESLIKQAALLDAELQALIPNNEMDGKIRTSLQSRFHERSANEGTQMGLIRFMNVEIDEYAAESIGRVSAIPITQAMLFSVVRLFSNLYSQAANK